MGNAERDQVWDALVQRQLKRLPPPASLSAAQLSRITQALDSAQLRRRAAPARALVVGAAVALIVAIVAGVRTLRQPENFLVPSGAVVKLSTASGDDIVIVGPAALKVGEPTPMIRKGRVVVRADKQSEAVRVPEGGVRVAGGSLVVVEVRGGHTVVAAYSGTARVEWQEFPSAIQVGTGTIFSSAGVRAISNAERSELDALIHHERRDLGDSPQTTKPTSLKAVVALSDTDKRAVASTSRRHAPVGEAEIPRTRVSTPPPPQDPNETAVVATAIRQLNDGAPADALASLDAYWMQHPGGKLAPEAEVTAIEALLRMHRSEEALIRLDAMPLDREPDGARLAMIRGELRAEKSRCGEAIADFSSAITAADRNVSSRARYDRGVCRARLGDASSARVDLDAYLASEPSGVRADAARRALLRL